MGAFTAFEQALVGRVIQSPARVSADFARQRALHRVQAFYDALFAAGPLEPAARSRLEARLGGRPSRAGAGHDGSAWSVSVHLAEVECVRSTTAGAPGGEAVQVGGTLRSAGDARSLQPWSGWLEEGRAAAPAPHSRPVAPASPSQPGCLARIPLPRAVAGRVSIRLFLRVGDAGPGEPADLLSNLALALHPPLSVAARRGCGPGSAAALEDAITAGLLEDIVFEAWTAGASGTPGFPRLRLELEVTWTSRGEPIWVLTHPDPAWALFRSPRERALPPVQGPGAAEVVLPAGEVAWDEGSRSWRVGRGLYGIGLRLEVQPEPETTEVGTNAQETRAPEPEAPPPVDAGETHAETRSHPAITPRAGDLPPAAPALYGRSLDDGEAPPRPVFTPGQEIPLTVFEFSLRTAPSFVEGTLRGLEQGELLRVLQVQGEWLRVRTSDGAEGWIHDSAVAPEDYWETLYQWTRAGS